MLRLSETQRLPGPDWLPRATTHTGSGSEGAAKREVTPLRLGWENFLCWQDRNTGGMCEDTGRYWNTSQNDGGERWQPEICGNFDGSQSLMICRGNMKISDTQWLPAERKLVALQRKHVYFFR